MTTKTTTPANVSKRVISEMSNEAQKLIEKAKKDQPTTEAPINKEAKETPIDAAVLELKEMYDKLTKEQQAAFMKQIKGAVVRVPGQKTTPPYLSYLTEEIKKGELTQKELLEKACKEFPAVTKSTISTVLSDCKNPKYNRFPYLVIKGEGDKLMFKTE